MIKVTAKEPTPEERLSRVFNVQVTVDTEEEERKAINRIVRSYVEIEMSHHSPNPQKAIESALEDLFTLGVIQNPDDNDE